jgi:hypothetical protein
MSIEKCQLKRSIENVSIENVPIENVPIENAN